MVSRRAEKVDTGDAPAQGQHTRMTQMTDRQAGAARQRVLDVAQTLFEENGYAGTSIGDIADRLEVSKAAVYYHFHAKADLLHALVDPVLTELHEIAEGSAGHPRALLERLIDVLSTRRPMIGLLAGDPSAMHELKATGPHQIFAHLRRSLAGPHPSATKMLRARCAMGAVHAAVVGPVVEQKRAGGNDPITPMTSHERRVVITAALATLGVHDTSTG
jgi:AcrR family transcriptional regulator